MESGIRKGSTRWKTVLEGRRHALELNMDPLTDATTPQLTMNKKKLFHQIAQCSSFHFSFRYQSQLAWCGRT